MLPASLLVTAVVVELLEDTGEYVPRTKHKPYYKQENPTVKNS